MIVDPRAPNASEFLQKLPANTEVKFIDQSRDGYQQISEILQSRGKTEQLHLVTSELDGQQWLGSTRLTNAVSNTQTEAIAQWGDRLAVNAGIVFHGEQAVTQSWLQRINALTGAQATWLKGGELAANVIETRPAGDLNNENPVSDPHYASVKSLVFIDKSVKDYQALLQGIDSRATVILLDSNTDGVSQIARIVSRYKEIEDVHIISHGSEGKLKLGSAILDQDAIHTDYMKELAQLNRHLSANADILIYGCDVAIGKSGQNFIDDLAQITGADIAASINLTGAAARGGDWILERANGRIESRIVVDAEAQQKFAGVLRAPNTPRPGLVNAPTSSYTAKLADTFRVNGAAASITSDNIGGQQVIQLTTATNNRSGSAWSRFQIDLTKDFTIDFDVYLGTLDGSGADGIAFALQNSGPNVTGGFGGGLGVQNISNAVAIEFDTWNNGANTQYAPIADIASDHISMYRPKTTTYSGQSLGSSAQKNVGNIENDTWYNCVVNWNAATKTLSYTFAGPPGTVAGGASGIVTDSTVINDPNAVFGDNNVYFGWAASTGGSINDQRVAINSITDLSPEIDLNGPASGVDNAVTFTENSPGVSIMDPAGSIGDPDNANMESAKIVLTDKQALDQLLVGGSSSPNGTINGLNYTIVDDGTRITVTLTGSASQAAYTAAIKAVTFANTSEEPSGADRHVSVTVNDGNIDSSPATTTIRVLPVNDPPAGADKTITLDEDTPYTISVDDFGYSDAKENPVDAFANVVITQLPPSAQGVYKLNGVDITANQIISVADISAGLLTFTPKANVNGNNVGALGFRVQDNGGTANGGINTDPTPNTLKFTLTPVNDPPVAATVAPVGTEDSPVPVNLGGADVDGTVQAVTVSQLPPATQGILYLADGKTPVEAGVPLTPAQAAGLIFKPAPNFAGQAEIPFTVTDNQGALSAPAKATVTVAAVNDPPVAISGSTNTAEDTPARVNLTGTDVDGAVQRITVTRLPLPTEGVLYLPDGVTPVVAGAPLSPAQAANLVFKPALDFNGLVDIGFTVTDNTGDNSEPGTYVIDVAQVNDDPVATPATVAGPEDQPVPVSLTGTDVEGPITAVTVVSLPPASQGILTKADGRPVVAGEPLTPAEAAGLRFNPAPNFNGKVVIPFTVTDSDGEISSPPANLTITLTPVNDPPVAATVAPAGTEDSPVPVNLGGADVDGTVQAVTVSQLPPATQGILYLADGKTPVEAGVPLTPAQAAGLIFKPAPNFAGQAEIPFTVTDNQGALSAPAKATVTVAAVNDPPVAISGSTNTAEDTPARVNLTGTDVDGAVQRITVTRLPLPTEGVLYLPDGVTPVVAGAPLSPAQAANLVFKPALDFNGLVDIGFTVTDNTGDNSEPGTYVIDVAQVNDDPVATPATVAGPEDQPVPVSLTGTDVEGPITAVTVVSLPPASQGILTKADGRPVVAGEPLTPAEAAGLRFNPAPNFNGKVVIPFTVTDSDGEISSPPANLTITLTPVNDPPVAATVAPAGTEDSPVPVNLGGADVDGTVQAVTVSQLPPATQGILYLADGKTPVEAGVPLTPAQAAGLIFKPAPNFAGQAEIPFTVTDNQGALSAPAKATVTVAAVNDPPVAISGSTNTAEDTPARVNLTGTDVDGAVQRITVTRLPLPTEGVLYLPDGVTPVVAGAPLSPAPAANLVFKPALDFNGLVDIGFTAQDDSGVISAPGRFVIDVNFVDIDPIATPAVVTGPENTPLPVALTGTDAEGPITAVTVVSLPPASQGILYLPDGETPVVAGVPLTPEQAANLIFMPAPNFFGSLTIPFTVTDSVGQIASPPANLTINVLDTIDENIGALILLSNPTPPLFAGAGLAAYDFIPLTEAMLTGFNEGSYQFNRLSLYQDLPDCDLYLTGPLRNQMVQEKQYFTFTVPKSTFRHSNASEELEYQATKRDGRPLPSWLNFNPEKLKFSGTPPKGALNTEVMVIARDHCGNRVYVTFTVKVGKEPGHKVKGSAKNDRHSSRLNKAGMEDNQIPAITGKLSFNEQVCQAGKLSRLMESRALLNSLAQL